MIEQRPTTQTIIIDDEPIIDVKALGHYVGFALRAIKRRSGLVWTTIGATAIVVALLMVLLPRFYKVSSRILTHRSLVMPALVHPDRAIPQAADAPTSGAIELIKSRENLQNLMTDTRLVEAWDAKRPPLWKAKDWFSKTVLREAPSAQDREEAFLKLLDDRVVATVDGEVVSMDVEWPDADIAKSLADATVARFLKIRHDMELSEILETVNILERNVESSRQGIEEVVARMQKTVDNKERELASRGGSAVRSEHSRPRRSRVIAIRRPAGAERTDPAVDTLKRALAEKQAAVNALRRAYDAKIKSAQADLSEKKKDYGPQHPDVKDAQRTLDSLSQPPPELTALQAEEARLAAQVSTMPAIAARDEPRVKVEAAASDNPGEDHDLMRVPVSDEVYAQVDKDPEIASVMEEIKKRMDGHDDLLQRLANARMESETANVAFEYRYILTMPPVHPKKVVKPNLPLLGAGGMVVAVFLGALFAIVADVVCKRVLEAWQLERFLKLRVLGEVDEA